MQPKVSSKASVRKTTTVRGAAQRVRILTAARQRFIEQGFHAASMASIAEQAGMSIGLLYRYFDNKRSIILAIIEHQLVENREALAGLQLSTDFVSELTAAYELWGKGEAQAWNAVLFSEVTAECARSTDIAEALQRSERASRLDLMAWLQKRDRLNGNKSGSKDVEARAMLMQCLVEGLAIRAAREPHADKRLVKSVLSKAMPIILSP